jgi:hypothetical protein
MRFNWEDLDCLDWIGIGQAGLLSFPYMIRNLRIPLVCFVPSQDRYGLFGRSHLILFSIKLLHMAFPDSDVLSMYW